METEARMSRKAWGRSADASDLARAEVMSLRTIVHAQMSEIIELQSADRSRQKAISDLLEREAVRRMRDGLVPTLQLEGDTYRDSDGITGLVKHYMGHQGPQGSAHQ
ncbi:hypothetical protein Tco_0960591 [Tanacetum coccineum]